MESLVRSHLGNDLEWGLARSSDLDQWVLLVDALLLTDFADVVVVVESALIADPLDRIDPAAITLNRGVNLSILLSLLVHKVSFEHLSELLAAVLTNLSLDKLGDLRELIAHDYTSCLALPAWKTLLVDLGASALEADHLLLDGLLVVSLIWDQKLAVDLAIAHNDIHLASLGLGIGLNSITPCVLCLLLNLAAKTHGVNSCTTSLVFG